MDIQSCFPWIIKVLHFIPPKIPLPLRACWKNSFSSIRLVKILLFFSCTLFFKFSCTLLRDFLKAFLGFSPIGNISSPCFWLVLLVSPSLIPMFWFSFIQLVFFANGIRGHTSILFTHRHWGKKDHFIDSIRIFWSISWYQNPTIRVFHDVDFFLPCFFQNFENDFQIFCCIPKKVIVFPYFYINRFSATSLMVIKRTLWLFSASEERLAFIYSDASHDPPWIKRTALLFLLFDCVVFCTDKWTAIHFSKNLFSLVCRNHSIQRKNYFWKKDVFFLKKPF